MNLIALCDAVRAELYPDLNLIKVSHFPIRVPLKNDGTDPIREGPVERNVLFPYAEIWDRAYTVEYQAERPLSTLVEMLKLERYLFKCNTIMYTDKLWTYEYTGIPVYVIRCAQVNR